MKKNKTEREASKAIEAQVETATATEVEVENKPSTPTVVLQVPEGQHGKRKPGRPADPNKVAAKLAKQKGSKGRPIVEGSARQKHLAEMKVRAIQNGGVIQKGRPKMDPIELEARRAKAKAEKLAARQAELDEIKRLAAQTKQEAVTE